MKRFTFTPLFGLALLLFLFTTNFKLVIPQDCPAEKEQVKQAVERFIKGINELDVEAVGKTFSADATAFYPFSFTPQLLKGRAEIMAKQTEGFELMHQIYAQQGKPAPKTLGLAPADFEIQMLTNKVAVVNWHSPRPTHIGRRTAVLQKIKGEWLIVSHHASNLGN